VDNIRRNVFPIIVFDIVRVQPLIPPTCGVEGLPREKFDCRKEITCYYIIVLFVWFLRPRLEFIAQEAVLGKGWFFFFYREPNKILGNSYGFFWVFPNVLFYILSTYGYQYPSFYILCFQRHNSWFSRYKNHCARVVLSYTVADTQQFNGILFKLYINMFRVYNILIHCNQRNRCINRIG